MSAYGNRCAQCGTPGLVDRPLTVHVPPEYRQAHHRVPVQACSPLCYRCHAVVTAAVRRSKTHSLTSRGGI